MNGLTLRLAAALLAFSIGITTASLWVVPRRVLEPKTISAEVSQPAPLVKEEKRIYQHGIRGSGYSGRYRACFGVFSSSDGMKFSSTDIFFDSPQRARRELQKRLKHAAEIVKRQPIFDERGRKVGERVVATFTPDKDSSAASAAEVIWAEGSNFGYIGSSSVDNILEHEKERGR